MSPTPRLEVIAVDSLGAVPAEDWDALVSPDDPFTRHAFLHWLEASGSVGAEAGWVPAHVMVRQEGRLVGAAPLYIKNHSYGEYIFDWGWAEASQRAGIPYYPKLVCAVPLTPATGSRLLVHPSADRAAVQAALLAGMRHVAEAVEAHSLHILFCTQEEHEAWAGRQELIGRQTHQYHWLDQGYGDFEGWLATFRHKARKEARRERRRAAEVGAEIRLLEGAALDERAWRALHGFYLGTIDKKWSHPYLTEAWFGGAAHKLAESALAWVAEVDGEAVAGALYFHAGEHLYGRYWGCRPGFEALHFELCYHRPIELCLARGWTRYEAGAQGQHKIKRGLLPAPTWSLHWLEHPGLAKAVGDACKKESRLTEHQIDALEEHGPFRRGHEG